MYLCVRVFPTEIYSASVPGTVLSLAHSLQINTALEALIKCISNSQAAGRAPSSHLVAWSG